jgi:O-antigen ligase
MIELADSRASAPHNQLALAAAIGVAILISFFAISFKPVLGLLTAGVLGAAVVLWAVRYTTIHPMWVVLPLNLVEVLTSAWFFEGPTRSMFHYGMAAAFCLPLLPAAWRKRTFTREGFGLYICYFAWAAFTITYSLAPEYSASRLVNAAMMFAALSLVVSLVEQREEVYQLISHVVLGFAIVWWMVVIAALVLPRSITWLVPDETMAESAEDVVRFCGIFGGPNDVGELMLVTVGCAAVLWRSASRKRRLLLAMLIAAALGGAVLADSRTPCVAVAVGATAYCIWRYRGRAILAMLVLVLLAATVEIKFAKDEYVARGNVSTLTGRTEVWKYAIGRIEEHPLTGYGYDVAGAILQNRLFPVWWGPWDEGPHSSLHNGYIDRAVCTGVPSLIFWLFIVLRPWYAVLKRKDDPWELKPMVFWLVLPMLIHNLAEVSISDCTGMIGLTFILIWGIAERARVLAREQELAEQRQRHAVLPPAAAALTA